VYGVRKWSKKCVGEDVEKKELLALLMGM